MWRGDFIFIVITARIGEKITSGAGIFRVKITSFLSQACTRAAFLKGGRQFRTRQKDRKGIYPGLLLDFTTVCVLLTWRG